MTDENESIIPDAQQKIEKEKPEVINHNFAPTAKDKVAEEIEEITEELNVSLPETNTPLVVRLIGLLLLVGGLSMLGSTFGSIFNSQATDVSNYLFRISGGLIFIIISYGLLKQKIWSIWIFATAVIVGAFINPTVTILPALIVLYLFLERGYFKK